MQLRLDLVSALLGGNIALERLHAVNRLDGKQIDGDDRALDGHLLHCHLGPVNSPAKRTSVPSSGRCAQIHQHVGSREEVELSIQLDKLESRTGAIALLLCKLVPLISGSLSLFRHRQELNDRSPQIPRITVFASPIGLA